MKILIIDTYYHGFLKSVRNKKPGLGKLSYDIQIKYLLSKFFGTSDFFSYNLNKLGWKVEDVIANDEILQRKWAQENKIKVSGNSLLSSLQSLPYVHRFLGKPTWTQEIVIEQIKLYKPDIVYLQDLSVLNPGTLKKAKKLCKLLVGQIACPLPPEENLRCFDLIITSFPHYVNVFKKMGIKSEYQKLAFEPRILSKVGKQKRIYPVTFIGSFTPYHQNRTRLLEEVAEKVPVHIWGQGLQFLSPLSHLRKNFHGEAWGKGMFKILAKSEIVINSHIGVANKYANNMRLYEATGMGAMLVTDEKKNLDDLFRVGQEVVAYSDSVDLVEKINYYLKHPNERKKIADRGQRKTLNDHNYTKRMTELIRILRRYL